MTSNLTCICIEIHSCDVFLYLERHLKIKVTIFLSWHKKTHSIGINVHKDNIKMLNGHYQSPDARRTKKNRWKGNAKCFNNFPVNLWAANMFNFAKGFHLKIQAVGGFLWPFLRACGNLNGSTLTMRNGIFTSWRSGTLIIFIFWRKLWNKTQ